MRILSLGLDKSVLDRSSALAGRVIEYGGLADQYFIIVPSAKKETIELSEKAKAHGSGGNNKLAQLIKIYFLAKKLLRQPGFDVITVQDQYFLALIGLRLAKKFKLGLEIQVHGFEKLHGLRSQIAKYVLPRAQSLRCVSQRLKKQLISDFGVAAEKITVVPIHSKLTINNYQLRIKESKNNFVFLTVGRLVPVKNIGLQIEALAELTKHYPKTELWIVGQGPERKNYELRITNYELAKNVKLLGWKGDVDSFYNQADAFVLTSNFEGWGMAVVEAASFGLPIIMTDVGIAGEVIKNGESGLIIPLGDKKKLVEVMIKLIENARLRASLAESAKLAVKQLPNKEQTLNLYKASWQKAMPLKRD